MRILLDTNVFLWCLVDDKKLTPHARSIIVNADERYVSSASIWEVAIKKSLGKLNVDIGELADAITSSGFLELPITAKHASLVFGLPNLHRDPFDRLLIAQAMSEPLIFLTADKLLNKYSDLVEII